MDYDEREKIIKEVEDFLFECQHLTTKDEKENEILNCIKISKKDANRIENIVNQWKRASVRFIAELDSLDVQMPDPDFNSLKEFIEKACSNIIDFLSLGRLSEGDWKRAFKMVPNQFTEKDLYMELMRIREMKRRTKINWVL